MPICWLKRTKRQVFGASKYGVEMGVRRYYVDGSPAGRLVLSRVGWGKNTSACMYVYLFHESHIFFCYSTSFI